MRWQLWNQELLAIVGRALQGDFAFDRYCVEWLSRSNCPWASEREEPLKAGRRHTLIVLNSPFQHGAIFAQCSIEPCCAAQPAQSSDLGMLLYYLCAQQGLIIK